MPLITQTLLSIYQYVIQEMSVWIQVGGPMMSMCISAVHIRLLALPSRTPLAQICVYMSKYCLYSQVPATLPP